MKPRKHLINILCCATATTLGMYLASYQSALPSIKEEYGITGLLGGVIVALHYAAAFFFPFLFGTIADRIGRKPVLLLCFGLVIAGLIFVTKVPLALFVCLGIFLIGGFNCVLESSTSSMLSECNPGQENQLMNLSQMFFCLGAMVAPLTNRLLGAWRKNYLLICGIFLVLMVGMALTALPPPHQTEKKDKKEKASGGVRLVVRVLRSKYNLLLLACMFLYVGVEECSSFWCGEFVVSVLGDIDTSFYLSAYWMGMCLCRLILTFIKGRTHLLTLIATLLSVADFGAMFLCRGPVGMMLCFFGAGFLISPIWPLIMTEATVSNPDLPDTAAGCTSSAGSVGAILMPLLLSTATEISGIRMSFAVLLGIVAVMCGLLAALTLAARKHAPAKGNDLE